MAQMVLPQAPVPGIQKDSGPIKPDSSKGANRSDSRFEAVSRAEQKRMDQKTTERAEEPRPANDPSATASASAEGVGKPGGTGAKKKADQTSDEVSENAIPVATPLTFADLRALLVPADEQAAAEDTATGTFSMSGVFVEDMPGNGLAGGPVGEKPGSQGQGLTALTLTDALAGPLASDSGRDAEAANLLAPTRFQATLDTASQQATKLSVESALPLKGYATSIDLPVGHSDWGDKMAGKLSWLTVRGMSVAEIHLTPPDMGPMEVKVKLHHDQATVTVHAVNPAVRDQLELNSHRLRDMLAEQGVILAQFDVSDSSQQQSGEQATGDSQGSGGRNTAEITTGTDRDEGGLSVGHLDLSWKGEIDIYA